MSWQLYLNQNLPLLTLSKPSENTSSTMPAYCSSSPSPSSVSNDSYKRIISIGSPNITFIDFLKLCNNTDSFLALQHALFERQDLLTKTSEIKYFIPLIERLQEEANRQQDHIIEIFNTMEAAGLHELMKKHFVRDNRNIRTRRQVDFNIPSSKNKYSLRRRRSTPYPPAITSIHNSQSEDSLPTGNYRTISQYPLDGGFIHHYIRPTNPEPSTSSIIPKEEPLPVIQATQTMPKFKIDWITYQGGMGSRFNPIIIEDD